MTKRDVLALKDSVYAKFEEIERYLDAECDSMSDDEFDRLTAESSALLEQYQKICDEVVFWEGREIKNDWFLNVFLPSFGTTGFSRKITLKQTAIFSKYCKMVECVSGSHYKRGHIRYVGRAGSLRIDVSEWSDCGYVKVYTADFSEP